MRVLQQLIGSDVGRRSFLRGTGVAGLAAATAIGGALSLTSKATAKSPDPGAIPAGDLAILRFLAAAELVEDDLWQQYTELSANNPGFRGALKNIDDALPRYINDDRDDERSHANLINAYLISKGYDPVNLDPFRTLPSVSAQGSSNECRLTNLRALTVDTSWFNRYRGAGNPDFGDQFQQFVSIVNRPTVPTSNSLRPHEYRAVAYSAAYHFCAIEQGGASLYTNLLGKVVSDDAVAILSSIGPTELYHFVAFHKSLEGMRGFNAGGGLTFPHLKGTELAQAIMPEPCRFIDVNFPLCAVVRPRTTAKAGAVAAATGLVQSGLFNGQSSAFLNAVVGLAQAADNAG